MSGGISYEDRVAYQDGIRVGVERGANFEQQRIIRVVKQLDQSEKLNSREIIALITGENK